MSSSQEEIGPFSDNVSEDSSYSYDNPPQKDNLCNFSNSEYESTNDEDYVASAESSIDSDTEFEENNSGIESELCHLEGESYLAAADHDSKLAGIVGALVHLRENHRNSMKMWGDMWRTLNRQNKQLIDTTGKILEEIRKRPAVTEKVPPAKLSKRAAKLPIDCSVSSTAQNVNIVK